MSSRLVTARQWDPVSQNKQKTQEDPIPWPPIKSAWMAPSENKSTDAHLLPWFSQIQSILTACSHSLLLKNMDPMKSYGPLVWPCFDFLYENSIILRVSCNLLFNTRILRFYHHGVKIATFAINSTVFLHPINIEFLMILSDHIPTSTLSFAFWTEPDMLLNLLCWVMS